MGSKLIHKDQNFTFLIFHIYHFFLAIVKMLVVNHALVVALYITANILTILKHFGPMITGVIVPLPSALVLELSPLSVRVFAGLK